MILPSNGTQSTKYQLSLVINPIDRLGDGFPEVVGSYSQFLSSTASPFLYLLGGGPLSFVSCYTVYQVLLGVLSFDPYDKILR